MPTIDVTLARPFGDRILETNVQRITSYKALAHI